ncbi:Gfo/Idh/MocA family protein [Parvularcula maris]|uniref:Gfo/Idh/MocA family oxidoreductase n=1 Tax=Parvularcula maris TaxID=2965077 RepID=A0A9X2LCQ1_9PROT|nr:Gfo/Idh/MocA family oxidoreductase [Parvularcula maris]MCQ8186097.1 Gfo/Idh/MocA family oxidoreductase [Parvularcula maris]
MSIRWTRRGTLLAAGAALTTGAESGASMLQDTGPQAAGQPFPQGVKLPRSWEQPPSSGRIGIAVVGLGRYALARMMPAFAESRLCRIAGLVSGNRQKAARVADAYGLKSDQIYSYDSFDRLAEDDRIDAVYIVLPSGLHAEWTEKAFAAGKHVLCEKPMALSPSECERMIAASKAADRKLMIAYRCHFEPYNLKLMELMREGAIGELRTIRTNHQYKAGMATPQTNWRLNRRLAGGGPLEDYGLYGLQASLYISGQMPERISASVMRPEGDARFQEIAAHTASQLTFPGGAAAQLSTSYDAAGLNRLDIFGSEGRIVMEPGTSYGGQTMTLSRGQGSETLTPGDPQVQFAGQLDHFAEAVREGTPIKTPGEIGLRDSRLIEAIYRAAATGRSVEI